ncbi:hypothetical protein COU88_05635 [Candidatus Roizmanbacteria bacterium CG10_big_fil_rev_8_21_14_0_10_39_6]|uniref:Methyltransferase FkbM domain-containing protein n=1 Tax=Candidatus Roizmanbacteria bacterium CG10_big_fil_rev_8_21_14_0_10_39_6 TaxID=1974853 RepID=A0A2M8KQX2_9BACT|nr:MAG: hypothetical protein COU88_05635 [Candidatus Roizmanbacteria bacterium CG10_big_fil_rev_8_21_14_0_10_39_6]
MVRIENIIGRFPKIARAVDSFLPEEIKTQLRRYLLHETFPMPEPFIREIHGIRAKFWIRNPSDFYRIARDGFEDGFAEELIDCINPGDIFLDIGSAQGFYSILAAKAGAEVYSIDPDRLSYQSIKDNIALNAELAGRISVLEIALGDTCGTMALNYDEKGTYASSLRRTAKALTKRTIVEIVPLDKLIEERKIKPPNVIKIDVEGAEGLVLKGMEGLLKSNQRPQHLFIEIHEQFLPQFGTSAVQVLQYIQDLGFVPFDGLVRHREKQLCHYVLL